MKNVSMAVIGAGPYGLSLSSHLTARQVDHRIFGRPMHFWSQVAAAGNGRYLKSFCFGSNISTPSQGFTFADYNGPRGLETFEPCSIGNFADYGRWFQEGNVPALEPVDVAHVERLGGSFVLTLETGESVTAPQVVVATGLSRYAKVPDVLNELAPEFVTHTARISSFSAFEARRVAIIGAGQSALEAAALLHEAGALPQLLVRESKIAWQRRIDRERNLYQRIRSPITALGTGPRAWGLTRFPGATHRLPEGWRTSFVSNHLGAEGAWWLKERVEGTVPIHYNATVSGAEASGGGVALRIRDSSGGKESEIHVDHVVAGTGYVVDVDRLDFLDAKLRQGIRRIGSAPRLSAKFESSVPGLRFVGPASAMCFGPLFRFVAGADYTARTIAAQF